MTTGQRFLVTIFIVLAVMFALSLCGYNRWQSTEQSGILDFYLASAETRPEICVANDTAREHLRSLMGEALDEAFKDHIKALFKVWMADDRGQPERARIGAISSIRAHQLARKGVEEWMPPICAN